MLNFIKHHKYLCTTVPVIIALMMIIVVNTKNIPLLSTFAASAIIALISATVIDVNSNKED